MAQRKKRGRAAKAAYFVSSGNGNYVYTGPLYSIIAGSGLTARQVSMRRLLFCGCITALSLLCGLLPVPGMSNTFYVIIPYAGALIFGAVSLWKAARVAYWGGDKLREYVYESTVKQIPVLTLFCAVFAGISVIGEGLCLIFEKADPSSIPPAIVFILAHAVIIVLALVERRFESKLEWGNH